jgi:hypothetical protein
MAATAWRCIRDYRTILAATLGTIGNYSPERFDWFEPGGFPGAIVVEDESPSSRRQRSGSSATSGGPASSGSIADMNRTAHMHELRRVYGRCRCASIDAIATNFGLLCSTMRHGYIQHI